MRFIYLFLPFFIYFYDAVIVQRTLDGSAIQTFLSWKDGLPAETLIEKAGIPMQIPRNFTHDSELVPLLRHNVTPAQ